MSLSGRHEGHEGHEGQQGEQGQQGLEVRSWELGGRLINGQEAEAGDKEMSRNGRGRQGKVDRDRSARP